VTHVGSNTVSLSLVADVRICVLLLGVIDAVMQALFTATCLKATRFAGTSFAHAVGQLLHACMHASSLHIA
jgi:hypothetical protein